MHLRCGGGSPWGGGLLCGGGSPWGGGLLWRGVVLALVLLGWIAVVLVITPVAFAQSQTPEAPTAVAVYSIDFRTMEVRWSSSDAASTTSFKIQWKSGSQEFDSSRQVSSDPSTSIVIEQSTSAGDRYKATLTGSSSTAYTVRVIATNSSGDSDASEEVTGRPGRTQTKPREFIENEVVKIFESSFPWLREAWDYMTTQNVPVAMSAFFGGSVATLCSPDRPMESNLRKWASS